MRIRLVYVIESNNVDHNVKITRTTESTNSLFSSQIVAIESTKNAYNLLLLVSICCTYFTIISVKFKEHLGGCLPPALKN
jgi:hypothetical protein